MANLIQIRRGTSAVWSSVNPILSQGEIGFATDLNKIKIGDGTSNWSSLPYISVGNADTATALQNARTISLGGDLSGSASFDGTSNITITASVESQSSVNSITGTANEIEVSASVGDVTISLPDTINANTTGTAASLTTARTIALSGDVSGSVTFDGSASVDIVTTIQPNSVALGTDTSGDYVTQITGTGNGISVTGSGESASVVIENTGVTSLIGTANEIDISASTGSITLSLPATINADTTGNANTATTLANSRIISLGGDISGSASFNGGSDITISATIEPNSVLLGSDTSGDYVAQVAVSGDGLSITGSGESASVTLSNTGVTALSGTANEIDVSASTGSITLSLPSTINADTSGNAATATTLQTTRSISLGGDLSGSASFNGSSDITINATVEPNSISLGTDTTGDYVASVSASGSGISISGTGEGASVTVINTGVTSLSGTASQVDVSASNGSVTVSLPSAVTFPGTVTLNANPTQALQAATKQYVDAVAEGLHIHASVQTATTASIDLNSPPASIDNVTLTNNMRILVKNQSNTAENGIYVYNSASATLTRASDFDSVAEIAGGDFVFVTGGNTYDNTGWVQTETVTTLGTDPILWQQFSGAGTYSAGTGLALDGTVFSNTGVLSLSGTASEIDVSASSGNITLSLPTSINADTTGNAATATALQNSRIIELTGDVTGSASFNGTANASISATIAPNSVELGADTTGNYVATASAGTGIEITGSGSESAAITIANTGVVSLAGTANEVEVSASTGSITLSLPTTINADTTGNANTATTLANSRTFELTGDVTGSASFNGGANATILSTLANTAVTASSYGSASAVGSFTVDSKGRLTAASNTPIQIAQSAVTNLTSDLNLKANLDSPALTGTPTAPTAAVDTNTTQVATTAFVLAQASGANPLALGAVAQGTSTRYARQDHVHPTTGLALLTGATFTGNVTVVSPTAAGSNGVRQVTMSTSSPTGGNDGDMWLVYV